MNSKVTKFGNCAHTLILGVTEKITFINGRTPDMITYITECAANNLDYFEGAIQRGCNSDTLARFLANMAEMGMAGYYHMKREVMTLNSIANYMTDLYARKNRDYGNSFDKSMDKWGLVVSAIRIGDKVNRLQSLVAKGESLVKDESLTDTFIDLACYSVMSLMWLDDNKAKFD